MHPLQSWLAGAAFEIFNTISLEPRGCYNLADFPVLQLESSSSRHNPCSAPEF